MSYSSLRTPFNHLEVAINVEPLSEYIMEGLPRLAMKCFRLLTNSLVSRLGNKAKNRARVRLHENRTIYDFASLLVQQYFTGPAKSTPITWNGVEGSVLHLSNRPKGGPVTGQALNFLHP